MIEGGIVDKREYQTKLSVVIPVYNKHATIEEFLHRVQAVDLEKEIIKDLEKLIWPGSGLLGRGQVLQYD
jgi:hypothetical protein